LPAGCGFWAMPGGVGVEVAVGRDTPGLRGAVERSLADHGVPVRELRLVDDRSQLRHPLPLRCDRREASFRPIGPIIADNDGVLKARG